MDNCPKCLSKSIIKAGRTYKAHIGAVQMYLCKSCGCRTVSQEKKEEKK